MLPSIQLRFTALAAVLFLAAPIAQAQSREEYVQVQAKDLIKNPQKYWAQGIVFKDTLLTLPAGEARKLGDRNVLPFTTKVAGECFVDEAMVDALKNTAVGAQCIFSATIFQESSFWWFTKTHFRIIIQEFSVSSAGATDIKTGLSNLTATAASAGPYRLAAQRLDSILSQVQSELMAFSGESETPMSDILNPDGPHRERTMNSIRAAIARTEEEMRAPASVFLADLLTAILASQYAPAAAKTANVEAIAASTNSPVEAASATGAPKAHTPAMEKKPDAPAANPAPASPKPGFFSRLFGSGTKKQDKPVEPKPAKTEPTKAPAKKEMPAPAATNEPAPAVKPTESAPAKRSFWSRLFGSSDKPATQKTPAPATATPNPSADALPAR